MKKSLLILKLVSALFAAGIFYSCDSGGGGGGSSGGGNSNSSGSTSISITIPSATSSSSDINLLGDFGIDDTKDFCYEIYFKKGTKEIARKEGTPGKTVTFDNVTYDTYDFFLDIYVDSNKITKLNTLYVLNKTVSASNNTVTFPDMSTSTYKNWYFVKNVDDLTIALSKIAEDSSYNASNTAILCLLATIEDPRADSVKGNSAIQLVENGYSFAAHLYTVTLPSDLPAGCSVTTNNADNKFAEDVTVTLTVTAAEGWFFFPPTIDGVAIPRSEGDSTQFTFNMPADDVEVTTTFFDAIYVSESGNSENDGLSEATAVDSLASAIRKINDIGSKLSLESFDWTIKVCGTIRGAQTVVESMLFGTASVTIVGENEGTIDGNNEDSALTIDVTVPVTIKNLTIQNGTGNSSGSDASVTGGGMTISATSTVTIESEVVIESNTAQKYGGGILNRGTLTINGGAIKNNKAYVHGGGIYNQSGTVYIYGSTSISGNNFVGDSTLKYGGGIYNSSTGKVYLGYKSLSEKEAWTGSITGNNAKLGGGIWNAASAVLYFDSGTISSNTTTSSASSDSVELMGNDENSVALHLSGSVAITGGDKIYLADYGSNNKVATISVEENITNTISLTIDTDGYKSGTQILTGAAVGTSYTKFSLTNAGGYKIGDEGKLVTKGVDEFTTDDFAQFETDSKFQTTGFPTSLLALLNKVILYKKTGTAAYFVMKITELDSGVLGYSGKVTAEADLYAADGSKTSFSFDCIDHVNIVTGVSDEFGVPLDNHVSFSLTNCEIYGSSVEYYIIPED